jgi:hypothetical protein
MALRTAAVQIDGDIGGVQHGRERLERFGGDQFVDPAAQLDEPTKRGRSRQDDSMVGEGSRDRPIRRDAGEKIAQPERSQDDDATAH